MTNKSKNTLIALLKEKNDLAIAFNENWYRIPLKSAPLMVRNGKIQYLALYQPGIFKEDAFKIKWYSKVKKISIAKRQDLFPNEATNPKSKQKYYKIELYPLSRLELPIVSRRHRRLLFINTTLERLRNSKELNDVFIESPIEEIFWEALKTEKIPAERQFMVVHDQKSFYLLDFAIFTKKNPIDVECDSKKHHTGDEQVTKDNKRSNFLNSHGWKVLRFRYPEINNDLEECITRVKKTIKNNGGYQDIDNPTKYHYPNVKEFGQLSLFD
jgi:very-short-patch-repair endonuclease